MSFENVSDEELEKLILAIDHCRHDYGCSCKDFSGTYAEEAWKRYNNKKKECENLEQELKGWKRYESHYQPF